MTILWPRDVLTPQQMNIDLAPRTVAGPSSVSGYAQVVSSSAPIWKASLANIGIYSKDAMITFRAIAALLEGRLSPILIPFWQQEISLGLQPVPDGALASGLYATVPHSDDALFSDGTGYVGRVITVQLTSAVTKGATSAAVSIDYADTLQPGQHFSLDERLYRLKTVSYTSDSTANITFTPPARDAAGAGDYLEFDCPVCRMRLATDEEMNVQFAALAYASPTINLIEDV